MFMWSQLVNSLNHYIVLFAWKTGLIIIINETANNDQLISQINTYFMDLDRFYDLKMLKIWSNVGRSIWSKKIDLIEKWIISLAEKPVFVKKLTTYWFTLVVMAPRDGLPSHDFFLFNGILNIIKAAFSIEAKERKEIERRIFLWIENYAHLLITSVSLSKQHSINLNVFFKNKLYNSGSVTLE